MDRRILSGAVAVIVSAVCTLSGCSTGAEVGIVVVEVRSMAPGAPRASYDVTVFGADQEVLASRVVLNGSVVVITDVPFGWVTIEAASMCTVEGELSLESPTMRLVLETDSCALTE